MEKAPLAADSFEKNALDVLTDIAANQRYRNVPEHDGRLLRIIAQTTGAKQIVELGTSPGYSGIWFGLALRQTGGHLTTYEIDAERAATARKNFERAGMTEIITHIEGAANQEVKKLREAAGNITVFEIGDCVRAAKVGEAVQEGYRAAMSIV